MAKVLSLVRLLRRAPGGGREARCPLELSMGWWDSHCHPLESLEREREAVGFSLGDYLVHAGPKKSVFKCQRKLVRTKVAGFGCFGHSSWAVNLQIARLEIGLP